MTHLRPPEKPSFDLQLWILEQDLIKTRAQVDALTAIVFKKVGKNDTACTL